MEIIVDGRLAALKKGSSFDYIAENRFFTNSDSYTLSMEFPLRGCPQNIKIFGHLHRVEVDADDVVFDCEIRDKLFVVRGTLTVVGMSEVEVKCQFLEELEKFFFGKFHVDFKESKVTFEFNTDALRSIPSMEITNVIDEFSADISEEDGSDYQEARNLKYADGVLSYHIAKTRERCKN